MTSRAQPADIAPLRLRYRDDLEEILREANGEILPIPTVPHRRLIERAVARRRPFDANGDGYRDALVWESVLELLNLSTDPVALISNDKPAFSESKDKPELAFDLVTELDQLNQVGRVELFFTLRGYVEARVPTAAKLVREWQVKLEGDPRQLEGLLATLVDAAEHQATEVVGNDLISSDVRSVRFVTFANPRDLRVDEAYSTDKTMVLEVSIFAD
jgi:hypothetical protein